MSTVRDMYKFVAPNEKCYIAIGLISSLILGLMIPSFYLVFGGVINEISPTTSPTTIGN